MFLEKVAVMDIVRSVETIFSQASAHHMADAPIHFYKKIQMWRKSSRAAHRCGHEYSCCCKGDNTRGWCGAPNELCI